MGAVALPDNNAPGKPLAKKGALARQTLVPAHGRDTRIDALRGLSLVMIFVDHIPPNVANWYTLHNFSFSDAAEVFVFLAGISSMLAYGRAFQREGVVAGVRQVAARCAKIYAAQVALFLITIALAWIRRQAGYANPLTGPILDAGWAGVLRGMALDALPTYLDILPLYIVLLAIFPLVYALARVSPWLALAASGIIWLDANVQQNLNLPDMLSANGWYFNPFAWQLLFTIGVLSAALLRPAQAASPRRRFQLVCLAYLAFGFLETLNWAHWDLPDFHPLTMEEPSKSLLSPFRLLSILALMYLAFSSAGVERLCSLRFMRPLVACGRHSLEVFATGCLLAYASRSLFQFLGEGWLLQAGVNVVGVGATFAVAMALEKRRARRVAVKAHAASSLAESQAGNRVAASISAGT